MNDSVSTFLATQGYALPVYIGFFLWSAAMRLRFDQMICWCTFMFLVLWHGVFFTIGSADFGYVARFWHPHGPVLHDVLYGDVFVDVGERVGSGGHTYQGLGSMGDHEERPLWTLALPVLLSASAMVLLPGRLKWLAPGAAVIWIALAVQAVEEGEPTAEAGAPAVALVERGAFGGAL